MYVNGKASRKPLLCGTRKHGIQKTCTTGKWIRWERGSDTGVERFWENGWSGEPRATTRRVFGGCYPGEQCTRMRGDTEGECCRSVKLNE